MAKKEIWVDCRKEDLEKSAGLYGATGIFGKSSPGLQSKIDAVYTITSNKDIEELPSGKEYVFVEFSDWKVIPAENLIARLSGTKIIVKTNDMDEMMTLTTTLEKGVAGFLVDKEESLIKTCSFYTPTSKLQLVDGTVKEIKRIELGKRVCLDGIMTYKPREGLLAGFKTGFMFLADGETTENPYINKRGWRVNAGAASLYTLCKKNGIITPRYLDDLVSGDEVVVVGADGETRIETIGRLKKEFRPMTYIKAEYEGRIGSTCSQTAETVRLVTPDGAKPIEDIKVGDKVKLYVTDPIATHGGRRADERIEEV